MSCVNWIVSPKVNVWAALTHNKLDHFLFTNQLIIHKINRMTE